MAEARSLTPPPDSLFAQTQRTMFDAAASEHHLQNPDELTVDLLPEKLAAKVRRLLTAERFKWDAKQAAKTGSQEGGK